MDDHHEHVCHRMQAAQSTSSPGATSRGWDLRPVPARKETPAWIVLFIALTVPAVALSLWVMS